jgi:hypothetical protein
MVAKNPLWAAKQHCHSVHVMLDVYAAWTEGATDPEIAAIDRGMQSSPSLEGDGTPTMAFIPSSSSEFGTALSPGSQSQIADRGN